MRRVSWQFIWATFVKRPRTRAWLFENHAPPHQLIVQSLMNNPILTGYIFGDISTTPPPFAFPDIGDMETVVTRDEDVLLTLQFGYRGIYSIVPLLRQITSESYFSDDSVVSRRCARMKLPSLSMFIGLEFIWLTNGTLIAVSTSYPTSCCEYFSEAAMTIFPPAEAQILSLLTLRSPLNNNDDVVVPNNYTYQFIVSEVTVSCGETVQFQSNDCQDNKHAMVTPTSAHDENHNGALVNCEMGVSCEPMTKHLWNEFQMLAFAAGKTGRLETRLYRNGNKFGMHNDRLYKREARYTFLYTNGITTKGRIQRLLTQLAIPTSNPSARLEWPGDLPKTDFQQCVTCPHPSDMVVVSDVDDECNRGPGEDEQKCLEKVWSHNAVCSEVTALGDSVYESDSKLTDECLPTNCIKRRRCQNYNGDVQQSTSSNTGSESPPVTNSGDDADRKDDRYRLQSVGVRKGSTVVEKRLKSNAKTLWTCSQCGVNIRGKRGNLNRHIANKHNNLRAHGCSFEGCQRRFQTRLNLIRHERAVHQGRPFVCAHCPRAFKSKDDRISHEITAHARVSHRLACNVCGCCFARRSTLNRHVLNVHKIGTTSKQEQVVSGATASTSTSTTVTAATAPSGTTGSLSPVGELV